MIENNSSISIPKDLKPIIEEIINAHNEKRIKKLKLNNPTLWDLIDENENEPESKKIYIQIVPKK